MDSDNGPPLSGYGSHHDGLSNSDSNSEAEPQPQPPASPTSTSMSSTSVSFATSAHTKLPSTMFDDDDHAYAQRFQATPSLPTQPLASSSSSSSSFSMATRLAPTRPAFPAIPNSSTPSPPRSQSHPIPSDPWMHTFRDTPPRDVNSSGNRSSSPSPSRSPSPPSAVQQPPSSSSPLSSSSSSSSTRSTTPVPPPLAASAPQSDHQPAPADNSSAESPITQPPEPTPSTDPLVCRICRDESTPDQPLYTPCKCTGSIRHVHQACLTEWLAHSGKDKCEVCGARFQFKVVYADDMPSYLPLSVIVRNAIRGMSETVAGAVRVMVVSEVWLVGLPWVFGLMWGKLFNIVRVPRLIGLGAGVESDDGTPFFGPERRPRVPLGSSWIPAYLPPTLIESQLLCVSTLITALVLFVIKDWIADTARAILADDRRRLRELWADAVRNQPAAPLAARRRRVVRPPMRAAPRPAAAAAAAAPAGDAPPAPRDDQAAPDAINGPPRPPRVVNPIVDAVPDDWDTLHARMRDLDARIDGLAAEIQQEMDLEAREADHMDALLAGDPPRAPPLGFHPPPPPAARPEAPAPPHMAAPGPAFDFGGAHDGQGPAVPAPPPRPAPAAHPPRAALPDAFDLDANPEMAAFIAQLREQVQMDPALNQAMRDVAAAAARADPPAHPPAGRAAAAAVDPFANVPPAAPPAPAPAPAVNDNANNNNNDDDGPMQAGGLADLLGFAGPLTNLAHSLAMAVMILVMIVLLTQWLPFVVGAIVVGLRPMHALLVVAKWAAKGADHAADAVAAKILGGAAVAVTPTQGPGQARYRDMLFPARVVDWIDLAQHADAMVIDSYAARVALMVVGWGVLASVGLAWMHLRAPKDPRLRLLKRTLARAGDAAAQSLKLVVFVAIEWFVFPAYTGMLLHVVVYPITPTTDQGVWGRLAWVAAHWWSAFYLHWLIGANVMFHQSTLVQAARQVLRPGVLWFVRDVSDPNFSPYADIATKPVKTLVRKIVLSMAVYSAVTLVLGSTASLVVWQVVGPVRAPQVALLGAPIDLVVVGAAGPWIAAKVPAYTVTRWVMLSVMALLGRALRLTGFLFGGWHEDELATANSSIWHRVLWDAVKPEHATPAHVPIGKLESPTSHPVLEQHRIAVEEGKVQARSEAVRGVEGLYRVPAYDMVAVDHEPKQMLFPVDVHGNDLPKPRAGAPAAAKDTAENRNNEAESEWESESDNGSAGHHDEPDPNWDHWTYIYVPSRFTLRWISLVLGVVSIIGSLLGLLVAVPILIGRFDIPRVIYKVFGADPSTVMVAGRLHDMYAWVYGLLVLAGGIVIVSVVVTVAVGLWRRRGGSSVEGSPLPEGQEPPVSLLSRTGRYVKLVGTWAWLLGLAAGMFPLFVGRVGHAMVVVPLRMALNGHHPLPLFVEQVVATGEWKTIAWQWCCGFLCVQIGLCLLEVVAPNSALMERISRAFPNGVPDFTLLNHELFFPGAYYLTAFLVTRLAVSSLLLQFFPDIVPKDTHETFSTSFVAWGLLAAVALRYHVDLIRNWLQSVRDQEYQVTRLLQNMTPAQQQQADQAPEAAAG